jgi:hypothetical protein
MKIPMIAILAAAGMVAQAQGEPDAGAATVTVYVRADVGPLVAEGIAAGMFDKAGVHIQCRMDRPKLVSLAGANPNAGSGVDQPNLPVVLDITSNTPETLKPGALAYAQVYEGVHFKSCGTAYTRAPIAIRD